MLGYQVNPHNAYAKVTIHLVFVAREKQNIINDIIDAIHTTIFRVLYALNFLSNTPKTIPPKNPPKTFIVPKKPESSVLNPYFSTILSMIVLSMMMLPKQKENATESLMNSGLVSSLFIAL